MFNLSYNSRMNMKDCDPRLKQIAFRAIEITPIDFGIPADGGVRTAVRQKELFEQGVSRCDGYDKLSKHQIQPYSDWGKAIDFYAYVFSIEQNKHIASWDETCLSVIACAFLQAANELEYKIQWGGLWISFQDMPHIQLNEE